MHNLLSLSFPVYFEFGNSHILVHGITEILAFFIGFKYFQHLRKKTGDRLNTTNRSWVLVGAIFGALIGSRLLGGLEDPQRLRSANNILFYFYNNKTVVGGFLGGLIGVEWVKKVIGEKRSSGDLFVKPMILALIIGRIGCFSMGVYEETYGLPTSLPWGIDLGDGLLRHPVALYEIAFLSLQWFAISQVQKKYDLQEGSSYRIFMISYLLFRFLIDFIKPHVDIVGTLSMIQLACLAGLFYYRKDLIHPDRMLEKSKERNA